MSINRASDDEIEGLTTYCTKKDVLTVARGVNMDDRRSATSVLSSLGTDDERDELIDTYLPDSFRQVNQWARRDFGYHADVAIALDGPATDDLALWQLGFWPLLEFASLVVDDIAIDDDYYKVYLGEARVHYIGSLPPSWQSEPIIRRVTGAFFSQGSQNVEATISWGYKSAPSDIVLAQARETLAQILMTFPAINDPRETGPPGGAESVADGQYRIYLPKGGRYAPAITNLEMMAKRTCFSYHRIKAFVEPAVAVP